MSIQISPAATVDKTILTGEGNGDTALENFRAQMRVCEKQSPENISRSPGRRTKSKTLGVGLHAERGRRARRRAYAVELESWLNHD
jgi:hypothetical protein